MAGDIPLIPIAIIGVALFLLVHELLSLRRGKQSEFWPETEGTIIHARTRQIGDIHSTQHRLSVHYEYVVGGKRYTSRRYAFGTRYITGLRAAQETAAQYRDEEGVKVYYNPENPRQAALEPGIAWDSFVILGVGLVLLFIGLRLLVTWL
jgi:hypothetical protein